MVKVLASTNIRNLLDSHSDMIFLFHFFIIFSKIILNFALEYAVVAQLVEHQLPKLRVASSSLVYRSYCKSGS